GAGSSDCCAPACTRTPRGTGRRSPGRRSEDGRPLTSRHRRLPRVEAWTLPGGTQPPRLPGVGVPLRVHDTAAGGVRPLAPGSVARMYVCGITPYDATHLGHAATYLSFDLLGRVLRDNGHSVHYVQNVTDV